MAVRTGIGSIELGRIVPTWTDEDKLPLYVMYRALENCDQIWENPAYSEFYDLLATYLISSTIGLTRVQVSERLCAFVVEIQRFVCDRATPQ